MGNLLKAIVSMEAQGVDKATAQVSKGANKVEQSFKKMTPSSNQATQSLTNFGRIAQDAPFGIIGIANNINPLVESFQRLKESTGSTGGALKALGQSLKGPAGLGVLLSVVSSLALVFGDRLFGASKKSKELEDANQALAQSFAASAVKLASLVGIVKNSESSYDDKKKALQALNQEYGSYLTNFGQEAITAENVGKAYENIVNQLLRQAVVKGIQDEIAKAVEETAKQLIALERAEEKKRIQSSRTVATTKTQATALDDAARGLQRYNGVVKDGVNAEIDRQASIDDAIKTDNTYVKVLARIKAELMGQLEPLLNLVNNFDDLNVSLTKLSTKKLPKFDLEVQTSFSEIEPKAISNAASVYDRAGAILGQAFIDGVKNAATTDADAIFDQSLFDVQKLEAAFRKRFEQVGLNFFTTAKIDPSKSFDENFKTLTRQIDQINNRMRVTENIAEGVSGAFTSMFDAIASGRSALQSLGEAFKQLALDIIHAAIQALIFKAITALLNPVGAATGRTPKLVGSIVGIKGRVSSLGITNGLGGLGGFSRMNQGGEIGTLGGGISVTVGGEFRLMGNNLVAALANTTRSQNRLG